MNRIINIILTTILLLGWTAQAQSFDYKLADLRINQIQVEIGMSIWRDFMSIIDDTKLLIEGEIEDDGTGLMVAISIIALDESNQLPDDLKIIKAVVHNDKNQWDMTTSTNKESRRWAAPYGYSMVFRQGPRWRVHDYVTLSLVFEMGGQRHEIQSKKFPIRQTG